MENNTLENTYNCKNPLARMYFRWKVEVAIKLAKLRRKDVILDFGCGGGWLEQKLRGYDIRGYDINPTKTFIKDYRKVSPTRIFALDVFEHISLIELEETIKNFKESSKKFLLIVSVPTENWLSRKIRRLVGKSEVPKEHITRHWEITKLLKKHFRLKKSFNFFTVSYIFVFGHLSEK